MKEVFMPDIEDLNDYRTFDKKRDSFQIGQKTNYGSRPGTVVSKGDWISWVLRRKPIFVCHSRTSENCKKCPLLKSCGAPLRA